MRPSFPPPIQASRASPAFLHHTSLTPISSRQESDFRSSGRLLPITTLRSPPFIIHSRVFSAMPNGGSDLKPANIIFGRQEFPNKTRPSSPFLPMDPATKECADR